MSFSCTLPSQMLFAEDVSVLNLMLFLFCAGDSAHRTGGATICKTAQVAQQLVESPSDTVLDSVSFLSVFWHFSVSQ